MLLNTLPINALNFNDLERIIYQIGCEFAQALLKETLEAVDKQLMKDRDRLEYRHKGLKGTTLKTLMGEVGFKRAVYHCKSSEGETSHIYLLDAVLGFETFGKISTNLAMKIAENVSTASYRNAAKNISGSTGQIISHGGAWNVIQLLGERIREEENQIVDKASAGEIMGNIETEILFEEADGVWLNMQGADRPKKGRKRELKLAIAYDGWEKTSKDRYAVTNKVVIAGFEESNKFQKRKAGIIQSIFNTDEIKLRILNGDGGGWIKAGITDETVHFQLDPFHKNREITRKIKDEKKRETVKKLLEEKRIPDLLTYLEFHSQDKDNPDAVEKEKLKALFTYFENNKEGLLPYQERGLKIPTPPEGKEYRNLGTAEHNVCDVITKRMKHQKASWSQTGGENLAKILSNKATGRLNHKVKTYSQILLPERFGKEIEQVLSAARAPSKDGKGYRYPVNGQIPFLDAHITNGRLAIQRFVKQRYFTDLSYK